MNHTKTDIIKHDNDDIKLMVKIDHDSRINVNYLIDAIRQVCNLMDNPEQFKLDLDVVQTVTFLRNTVNCPEPNLDVDLWSIGIMTERASMEKQSTLFNMIQTGKNIGVKFFEIDDLKRTGSGSTPADDPDSDEGDDGTDADSF